MPEVAYRDLLGAMAFVDEMRRNSLLAQDDYDFNRLNALVREKIQAYYAEHGIAVDDDTVAAGVKEYFKECYAFKPSNLSGPASLLAYLTVKRRVPSLLLGTLAAFAVCCMVFVYDPILTVWASSTRSEWRKTLSEHAEWKTQISCERLKYASKECMSMIEEVDELAGLFKENLSLYANPGITERKSFHVARSSRKVHQAKMQSLMQSATALIESDETLSHLDTAELRNWAAKYPKVDSAWRHALAELKNGSDIAPPVALINSLLPQAKAADAATKELNGIMAELKAMKLDSESMEELNASAANTREGINNLDMPGMNALMQAMRNNLNMAKMPIKYHIVDRTGIPSGVIRTYGESSNAYYLIVEARGPDGKVVPLTIVSTETGKKRTVSQYGLQVPVEQYKKVQADKLADGIIDKTLVGEKPKNSFTCYYSIPFLNGRITDW